MRLRLSIMLGACAASIISGATSKPAVANVIGAAVANAMAKAEIDKCVGGLTVFSETAERMADRPAQVALANYWSIARANDDAQVGALFDRTGKAAWVQDSVEVRVHSSAVTDPYARGEGNVLVEKPIVLVRGRHGETARGIWEIRNSSGGLVGYYLADLAARSDWRPIRLELLAPDAPVPVVNIYCIVPGDIEAFFAAAKAIPESRIDKITKKSTNVATCVAGVDCSEKWALIRRWMTSSAFPLIRDTDSLLLTSGPVRNDLTLAYAVVLDPPTASGQRAIRFRAWCGNFIACKPTPVEAQQRFLTMLGQDSASSIATSQ